MTGSVLRSRAMQVLLAAIAIGNFAAGSWLCDEPATSVAALNRFHSRGDESVAQGRVSGPILVEGVYQEGSSPEHFIVEDAVDDRSTIKVHAASSLGAIGFESGDLVKIRGTILPASREPGSLELSLVVGEDGVAGARCHAFIDSHSTRRLTQSAGKKKAKRNAGKRGTAAKRKPKRRAKRKTPVKKVPRRKKVSRKKKPAKKRVAAKKRTVRKVKNAGNQTPKKSGGTPPPQPSPSSAGNTWKSVKSLPLAMGEVSSGVLKSGSKKYLVVVGQHPRGDSKNGVTMIFDFAKQMWFEATVRPEIGNHHASEVIKNKLYLFGGLSKGQSDIQIGTLKDTETGIDITWEKGATLPFDSGSAATGLIGGRVYYCGGINKANTATVRDCAIYDPTKDTWNANTKRAPQMPQGRNHAAACSDGKKLYVFGGRSGRNVVGPGFADTQILEPGVGWTTGKPLPLARGGTGKAVYHEGKCYVFGGEVSEDVAVSESKGIEPTRSVFRVDVYDIANDSWSLAKDMPQGLHGMFPVKLNGKVYIAAGGTEAAYSQSKLHFEYTL